MTWLIPLKCPSCGSSFKESDKHCPGCGIDLEAPVEKDSALAKEYFEKANKKYNHNFQLRIALSECELALDYDPDFAEAHNLHGLILDALNRTEEAVEAYREALRLNPNLTDASDNLRDALKESSDNQNNSIDSIIAEEKKGITSLFVTIILSFAVLAILAGTGWFVYKVALPYLTPKTEIIFLPDVPDDVQVAESDLELAAQILTERAKGIGYSQTTFEVTPSGEIIGKVPASVDTLELVDRIGSIGLLEFVDFGETSISEGTVIRTDFENKYTAQGEGKIWHTVMANDSIAAAAVSEGFMQGVNVNYQIDIAMTEKGSQIFAEYTQNNIGTFLGIVLNKIVISSPIINDAITGG